MFQQGLSGLNAASKSLDVIGNNIANAGNADKDWEWLNQHTAGFDLRLENRSAELAMLALQGPAAEAVGVEHRLDHFLDDRLADGALAQHPASPALGVLGGHHHRAHLPARERLDDALGRQRVAVLDLDVEPRAQFRLPAHRVVDHERLVDRIDDCIAIGLRRGRAGDAAGCNGIERVRSNRHETFVLARRRTRLCGKRFNIRHGSSSIRLALPSLRSCDFAMDTRPPVHPASSGKLDTA